MPAHYEMLVSHSPPTYSCSPPSGFLADYSTNCRLYDPKSYCRPQMLQQIQNRRTLQTSNTQQHQPEQQTTQQKQTQVKHQKSLNTVQSKKLESPPKSCLVNKLNTSDSTMTSSDEELTNTTTSTQQQNEHRVKKKVVFADDYGYSLTEIRIMAEPSNVPPVWSLKFLAHVTKGLISPVPPEQWTVMFRQPASDYLDFKKKLDMKNVSLENVIVKESESVVVGTVKVRNLSFTKEVIVRTSWDDWKTQEDTYCTYTQVGFASGTYVLYDTFSFKLTLPPNNRKLEFCVCYRCDDKEYWDNNNMKNYIIFKRNSNYTDTTDVLKKIENCKIDNQTKQNLHSTNNNNALSDTKYADLTHAKVTSWSEFASWSHLENTTPYCINSK